MTRWLETDTISRSARAGDAASAVPIDQRQAGAAAKRAPSSGASGFADGEEIVGADHQFDREADADRENQQPEQQPQMFAADSSGRRGRRTARR